MYRTFGSRSILSAVTRGARYFSQNAFPLGPYCEISTRHAGGQNSSSYPIPAVRILARRKSGGSGTDSYCNIGCGNEGFKKAAALPLDPDRLKPVPRSKPHPH